MEETTVVRAKEGSASPFILSDIPMFQKLFVPEVKVTDVCSSKNILEPARASKWRILQSSRQIVEFL